VGLEFNDIAYSYDGAPVLSGVSFPVRSGQITCLLGPSGCGKTTLMKLAAGILPMQHGDIKLNGQPLATPRHSPPPEKRPIGVVFQEGALFPHLTVAQNIGFGLIDKSKKDQLVSSLLEQVGLSNFGARYPHTLSGGQQQRVALARALAPEPQVLLLDEPFANIDILLRKSLRAQTRALLKGTGRVVMLVTHDPEEALEMADEIAVLGDGGLIQKGTPQALYTAPAALSVATLIGEAQSFDAQITPGGIQTPFGLWPLSALGVPYAGLAGPVRLAVRAADLVLMPCKETPGAGSHVSDCRGLRGGVQFVITAGAQHLTVFSSEGTICPAQTPMTCQPKPGTLMAFPAGR
jgi:iron(III) transport system ATP-binding protein